MRYWYEKVWKCIKYGMGEDRYGIEYFKYIRYVMPETGMEYANFPFHAI